MRKADLDERVCNDIVAVARNHHVEKVVLFGSRARGDNSPKSDIDLAIYGCHDFQSLTFDMEDMVWTLLSFDLIDMEQIVSKELQRAIEQDGIVIYHDKSFGRGQEGTGH